MSSEQESQIEELANKLDSTLNLEQASNATSTHSQNEKAITESTSSGSSRASISSKHSDESSKSESEELAEACSKLDLGKDATGKTNPPIQVYKPVLGPKTRTIFSKDLSTLEHIAELIRGKRAQRIIVMAGAGISTDAGIPDFRSPETGIYANLQSYNLPYPEAIFTMDYFRKTPKPFYVLAKELYPGKFTPTYSHFFVKLLEQKGLLLRHYTQNIDCLERIAGISSDLIVEAHGSFNSAHCISPKCKQEYTQQWVKDCIMEDKIPRCTKCKSLVKPDITFFGENLPSRFFDLIDEDFGNCDLLIVMGTSLEVHPFASLVNQVGPDVPRMLINRERVGETDFPGVGLDFDGSGFSSGLHRDSLILGDCDNACIYLAEILGWYTELNELRRQFTTNNK